MRHTAALAAGWDRRAPRHLAGPLGPSRGASRPGVPFLDALGPDARIIVEVAWGADLTADPDTWSWSDITGDVFYGGGEMIDVFVGAADEASDTQPANCKMRLNNELGDYSQGIQSRNWPNVRKNTPVRVRVDLGTGAETLWWGFADGFEPSWGNLGNNAMVDLSASGVLRRLGRRETPVISSFRRAALALSDMVAYWPAEDGENATSIASGLTGGSPLGWYLGGPDFAASSVFAASAPLPKIAGSAWYGPVAPYTVTGRTQVRALMSFPDSGSPDSTVIFRFHTTGTSDLWEMRYGTPGLLSVRAWGAGSILFEQFVAFDVDGRTGQFGIQLVQNGANVDWNIDALYVGDTSSGGFGSTLVGRTVGRVFKVETNTDDAHTDLIIGHITVQNAITDETSQIEALNAHLHENAVERIKRLGAENNVPINAIGNPQTGDDAARLMGYQRTDKLLSLLRDAEKVDQGVLHDGVTAGLTYITHRRRENLDPFVTIDVANGDLSVMLKPVDDDQRTVNKVRVSRQGGSDYTYEQTDGRLGTDAIGVYDRDETVNNDQDGELALFASWLVSRGTVEGYRYPRLDLELTHTPALLRQWLYAQIGGRLDILNIETLLPQHPAGTISLALEGYRHSISQNRWQLSANCSPYGPWELGVIAAETGDTGARVMRYDTDGASLALPVDAGAASLTVAFTGPRFTTLADDFPLQIDLDGLAVTVTNVTGTTSPQTFTVDPATVTQPRPAGAPIAVMTPPPGL